MGAPGGGGAAMTMFIFLLFPKLENKGRETSLDRKTETIVLRRVRFSRKKQRKNRGTRENIHYTCGKRGCQAYTYLHFLTFHIPRSCFWTQFFFLGKGCFVSTQFWKTSSRNIYNESERRNSRTIQHYCRKMQREQRNRETNYTCGKRGVGRQEKAYPNYLSHFTTYSVL